MKYNIIYADPPWTYDDKCSAGKRGAFYKYPLMTNDEIKSLDIQGITEKDCILFLWATYPKLEDALDVIKSWGFEYKTIAFTWVKRNKKSPTWFWGMGNWTRSNSEPCLLAVKGKPKRISASVHSIIESPIEEHSRKPTIVRDKIIQLCGDLPRLEMFARTSAPGWDVFGNEVDNSIII